MRKRLPAALRGSLALVLAAGVAGAQQPEPALVCVEGEDALILFGEHTVDGAIDTITDSDQFYFTGSEGDLVRFKLSETTTSNIELRLEVRDPDNVILLDTAPGGNIRQDLVLEKTGTYLIVIRENGSDEVGGYQLGLEIIPPDLPPPWLTYDDPMNDAINHITDTDFFRFVGIAGTPVRLNLSETTTSNVELRLELWSPSGIPIVDTAPGGNIQVEHVLEESGTYLVAVEENGLDEVGGYQLAVQCLSVTPGACPGPGPMVICDVQLDASSYTLGETVTADVTRVANPSRDDVVVDVKFYLESPMGPPISLRKLNDVLLPSGLDQSFGPWEVFTVTSDLPSGTYQVNCRMVDAATGRAVSIDLNEFTVL